MPVLARTSHASTASDVAPRAAAPDAALSPGSFRERGVVLPATTPAFAFARVREGLGGREIVMRNAAGTRGAMVLPLAKAADYARPTLHDRALLTDIIALPRLGPAQVGAIARAAARAGLAGRSALAAASAAGEAEARAARGALGRMLADLAGRPGEEEEAASDPKGFAARHHQALAREAAALGLAQEAVVAALARLAPRSASAARLAALLPRLRLFAAATADAAATLPEGLSEDAAFIASAASATAATAGEMLQQSLATLEDTREAVSRTAADPAWPGPALERAAWALDGWPALLARAEDASGQGRAAEARAFRVIAAAAPPLPAELAATPEQRARVRATWRRQAPAVAAGSDQAMLEHIRVAVP